MKWKPQLYLRVQRTRQVQSLGPKPRLFLHTVFPLLQKKKHTIHIVLQSGFVLFWPVGTEQISFRFWETNSVSHGGESWIHRPGLPWCQLSLWLVGSTILIKKRCNTWVELCTRSISVETSRMLVFYFHALLFWSGKWGTWHITERIHELVHTSHPLRKSVFLALLFELLFWWF